MMKFGKKEDSLIIICKYLWIINYRKGNGKITVGYSANGEASDWMLVNFGIVAMSPELGSSNENSSLHYIKDKEVVFDVIT